MQAGPHGDGMTGHSTERKDGKIGVMVIIPKILNMKMVEVEEEEVVQVN